ncbi:MAG: tetratricopeptide repeat protein [Treponema sp.]|jgi:tetratricopeptide (TPR) repeat protein|nr:tetratricopeptide repeat protein [Treponema sp.]
MPSLQALREFRSSFNELGGESASLRERGLPFNDLDLPEKEAEVLNTKAEKAAAEEAAGREALARMGLDPDVAASLGLEPGPADEPPSPGGEPAGPADDTGPDLGPEPADRDGLGLEEFGGGGDLDLSALLGSVPGEESEDISAGIFDESTGETQTPEKDEPEPAGFSAESPDSDDSDGIEKTEDTDLPDFGEEEGADFDDAAGEAGGEGVRDTAGNEDPSFDLGDLEGFDLGGEEPVKTGNIPGSEAVENPESADAAGKESFDIPGLEDFSVPGLDENGGNIEGIDNLDSLGDDFRIETETEPEEEAPPEADETDSILDDIVFEDGFTEKDLAVSPDTADGFDKFNVGDNAGVPDIRAEAGEGKAEEGAGGEGGEAGNGLADFTLQGFDDVFDNISGSRPAPATRPGSGRRVPSGQDEAEEINLNDQDLKNLQNTLNSYPLNLRIACEEIISEMMAPEFRIAALVRLLVRGAPPKETAALAGKILERNIPVPRGFQKKTGEELEAEQATFAYIFVHSFLPVLRLCLFVILAAASLFFLGFRFIYTPLRAESFYKMGYERIEAGEYERANERFSQAFGIHQVKKWFYRYAEAFRDQRQYRYAEKKYDELLSFYPRDKKGVLDYAALETYYLQNHQKADDLLRKNILDYQPNDPEALLALGDNALAWGETENSKYEDARFAYARYLERYGWKDPVVERMLKYFIRTDSLGEVLPLQAWFMGDPKRKISAETLAELGGYLLDKRTEETQGVPNEYVEQIQGVRDVLLRAVQAGPGLPEAHYHLSRYYRNLGNTRDEQLTLEVALRAFETAGEGSGRRLNYFIKAYKRHADILIDLREFKPAEAELVKAIGLYEDALTRNLLKPAPEFGLLFATMGDLEYFTKQGDMAMTLAYYRRSEETGWAPPEMLYRMGSAYYHLRDWAPALERFFAASTQLPLNRRLLLALGNVCYMRHDYFAAQGYYNRLLDLLEAERIRLPILLPNDRPEYVELADRLMRARNNMGVVLETLTGITGDNRYRAQALGYYSESARAWDTLSRNPDTMIRPFAGELSTPGKGRPNLNIQNLLYPQSGYEAQIFPEIDKDVLEPSFWEDIAP